MVQIGICETHMESDSSSNYNVILLVIFFLQHIGKLVIFKPFETILRQEYMILNVHLS